MLRHTAQSTYEPEPWTCSELAAGSNLRVEGILELSGMITVSSARLALLALLNTR